jgi:hypothetical protein
MEKTTLKLASVARPSGSPLNWSLPGSPAATRTYCDGTRKALRLDVHSK